MTVALWRAAISRWAIAGACAAASGCGSRALLCCGVEVPETVWIQPGESPDVWTEPGAPSPLPCLRAERPVTGTTGGVEIRFTENVWLFCAEDPAAPHDLVWKRLCRPTGTVELGGVQWTRLDVISTHLRDREGESSTR